MAIIKSVRGFTPVFGNNCYFADNAAIIGDVIMGDDCSVWFNTVLRGDVNPIRIGNRVNIQDGSVLHTLFEKSVVEIGNNVSIGHNVVVHGAKVCDNVLLGIGSIILDHVVIGENSIIAAGAVVLTGTVVEPGSLYAGVPAKKVKDVSPEQTREMIERIAHNYIKYAGWFKE
jgi:carbonic anhydrase/acetyltransferase-like protein (isoleucine patch superfamily)